MTIAHSLTVPAGRLLISYQWHSEMRERLPEDKCDRFKRIWTIIWVPLKVDFNPGRVTTIPEAIGIQIRNDWCSPMMVKQLVTAYLDGMEQAMRRGMTDASDVGNVLTTMEET